MRGRIANEVCSYDLMDNLKYECINPCLDALSETLSATDQELQLRRLKTFNSILTSPLRERSRQLSQMKSSNLSMMQSIITPQE